ncbi:MAG: hypothetical protein QMC83_05110 [Thermodesulfovibrionales bacterium]|nr:hypothetical protein [Thermodesulfovibrionales bacterium]
MKQLYKWSDPDEIIDTQYGRIQVIDWLVFEKRRLISGGRIATIRTHNGKIALFVDDDMGHRSRLSYRQREGKLI